MDIKESEKYQETREISILLADDHPLMRKALKMTINKEADFIVVGEAEDGEQVVKAAEELKPDLVILDISMPRLNGVQATKKIKADNPNIAILVLTVHDDIEHLSRLLDVGANGYLTKDIGDTELINAIRKIISGETVIAPQLLNLLIKSTLKSHANINDLRQQEILSIREMEILKLAAKGLSNRSIAAELNLSPFTVKTYMAEIFSKINVSSRTEAVILAIQQGLIALDDIQCL